MNYIKDNIYKRALRLSDITKTLLLQGNTARARRCMQAAENLFSKGSAEVKCAISGIFISSVSAFMELHNMSVKALFPKALQEEYNKQIDTV